MSGEIVGRITIAQEDRIRVVDALGRGYLLTVGKRKATADQLAAWQRSGRTVRVRYRGQPDLGAVAERIVPLSPDARRAPRTSGRAPKTVRASDQADVVLSERPPRERVPSPD